MQFLMMTGDMVGCTGGGQRASCCYFRTAAKATCLPRLDSDVFFSLSQHTHNMIVASQMQIHHTGLQCHMLGYTTAVEPCSKTLICTKVSVQNSLYTQAQRSFSEQILAKTMTACRCR